MYPDALQHAARSGAPVPPTAVQDIPCTHIHRSPLNPRKEFDDAAIAELAASIDDKGLLQPVLVRPSKDAIGHYELIAGERRHRAFSLLIAQKRRPATATMPAVVRNDVDDKELLLLATTENVARADLTPLEEARAYAALLKAGVVNAEIARRVGRSERHVEQRRALLTRLAPEAQKALEAGSLDLGKAKALILAPIARQAAILKDAIPRGDGEYCELRTAADVARRARGKQVLVASALFDLAEYKGEIATDPDKPARRFFVDADQFNKLQAAAIRAKVAELKEKWPIVETVRSSWWRGDSEPPHPWRKSKADGAGAIIVIDSSGERKPKVMTGVTKKRNQGVARAPSAPRDLAAEKAREEAAKFLGICEGIQEAAIRAALRKQPEHMRRLALLINLGLEPFGLESYFSGDDARKALDGIVPPALLRAAAKRDLAGAWAAALGMTDRAVGAAIAALLVQDVRWGIEGNDADLAIARAIGVDPLAGWTMDHAFLDACPDDVKRRIAADVGADVTKLASPKAWNATILASPKAKTYRPPWLELGTAAELEARLKPTSAKPTGKAKPKKAAKKGGKK